MVQVVTNENIQQLIETRSVPEFKAPEAPKPDANPAQAPADVKPATAGDSGQARNSDGTFASPEAAQAEPEKGQAAPQPAADVEDDDPALTERIRKLISKKHRAMKEAEEFGRDEARRAIAAEARAEALQKQIEALQGTKSGSGPAPDAGDEPKPEDFKTVGEYAKALTKYEVAQARKADTAQSDQDSRRQKVTEAQTAFAGRIAEVAKQIPDYYEVVEAADWDVPHHMQAYIVGEEMGPQVGYHLSKHRDEFDRIAKLKPISAFAELGKLADRLSKKPDAPAPTPAPATPQQVSRAPAPIVPLEGKTTPVVKDPSQMNFQELRAHREAERAAGRR